MMKIIITCPHCKHESTYALGLDTRPAPPEAVPDQPILELLVSDIVWPDQHTRIINSLSQEGIKTIGQLIQKTPGELLRQPNFGAKSLNAIKIKLAEFGLKLNEYGTLWDSQVRL